MSSSCLDRSGYGGVSQQAAAAAACYQTYAAPGYYSNMDYLTPMTHSQINVPVSITHLTLSLLGAWFWKKKSEPFLLENASNLT